ncbi:hypothetical protein IM538_14080 [Cytobacillus suaedae]|nr:hypothetical protein IM538_14080 [Cytobacillus suaedae]
MVDSFSKELKKVIEQNPVLTAILITVWIWYGSYELGVNIGEFIANIKN